MEVEIGRKLPTICCVDNRNAFLAYRARGSRVLHIGCVDSGLTKQRLGSPAFLHGLLDRVAARVGGVDVDAQGLQVMREHGFQDLWAIDIASGDIADLVGFEPDLILVPEVIEHVDSPVEFLRGLERLCTATGRPALITAPSAFGASYAARVRRGWEPVHPDHVAYFSYSTLSECCARAGLQVNGATGYFVSGNPFAFAHRCHDFEKVRRRELRWANTPRYWRVPAPLRTLRARWVRRQAWPRGPHSCDGYIFEVSAARGA